MKKNYAHSIDPYKKESRDIVEFNQRHNELEKMADDMFHHIGMPRMKIGSGNIYF